ncbi:MAG: rhodanese-like domain-containing protein [Cyanobacteria bacterium P01_F01_bin.13]
MGSVHRQRVKFLWATCLCLQLAGCGALAETSGRISQQELISQIEAGTAPLVLDVRTVEEYQTGHIPGAINVHFREINEHLDELNLSDHQSVVVYCERGIRANIAEQTLRTAGIGTILHLEGDMSQWRQNDLPLEQSMASGEATQPPTEISTRANPLEDRWIVTGKEAKQLIEQGATLLDTRKVALNRLQGSIYVGWKQFSPEEVDIRGRLLENDELLTQKLQSLGISQQKPVVVFANPPNGWGEDGRIVWMLRTLGHTQAVMVDGGVNALVKAGVRMGRNHSVTPGDFVVERNSTWEISRDQLKAQLGNENVVVIDTREGREYAGKTSYGEQRGGHVPGAINLYFKEFLTEDGTLLSPQEIRAILKQADITPDTQVIVYCTGGIRSGWLASVLVTLGYRVSNYAGSMWEWSTGPAESYPLEML